MDKLKVFFSLVWLDKFLPESWLQYLPANRLKFSLPLFIILCGFVLLFLLAIAAPTVKKSEDKNKVLSTVRVISVNPQDVRIPVYSQGVVRPSQELKLVSMVSGPVVFIANSFVDGGYAKQGELLLKVSKRSYLQDRAKAQARLAQAKAVRVAKQGELRIRGTLKTANGQAQMRQVNAAVVAAEADLERINDFINNTEIRAPFSGILRQVVVKSGQLLQVGMPLGQLYSPDKAEISLPLSDKQISLIDLPRFFSQRPKY